MFWRKRLGATLAAFGVLCVAREALANEQGVPGYTGKPNTTAPQGESCATCHRGGTAPQVTLDGPTTLNAGSTAEFTLTVRTSLSIAGAGVAATDGVVLAPVAHLATSFDELVQDAPAAVSGGQATFGFRVTAPRTGTTLRIWAVGLAANGNGATSGDGAAQAVHDVTIKGGAPVTSDAGTSGGSPGGTTQPSGSATSPSASASAANDSASDPTETSTQGRQRSSTDDSASCTIGWRRAGDAAPMALALALGAVARRRRTGRKKAC